MSTQLTLSIGALTSRPEAAALAAYLTANIAKGYYVASGADIQLRAINRGVAAGSTGGAVYSDTLHQALEAMTGFQEGSTRVSHIGLLIADSYQPAPGFFGYMFDDAFSPGGSDPWALTPREGCAVFLDGIAATGRPPAQLMEEAVFTSVHELGHVFNLQHGNPPSFMARSAVTGPIPLASANFDALQRHMLSQCSTSRFIWPGGSRFGDLGDLVAAAATPDPANRPPAELRIRASQDRFWRFEPVELDVHLAGRAGKAVVVADALDAGYGEFAIWIDQPDGERRKLRSPRHYCNPRGMISLAKGETFTRDISVFGQSGGYTFVQAGVHRLWCEFEYVPGRSITSNVIEVEVKASEPQSPIWRDGAKLMTERYAAQLLYYRRLNPVRRRRVRRFQDFAEAHRQQHSSAMIHYALGRAFGQAALASTHRNAAATREARRHLKIALRRRQLGDHRAQRAEEVLSRLG